MMGYAMMEKEVETAGINDSVMRVTSGWSRAWLQSRLCADTDEICEVTPLHECMVIP